MRRDRHHKVWNDYYTEASQEILEESFKRVWSDSQATTGLIFGEKNASRYKKLIRNKTAITLSKTKMGGEGAQAYIEYKDGQPRRLTFLIYHPEAHLCSWRFPWLRNLMVELYRIVCSVLYPEEPLKQLGMSAHRSAGNLNSACFAAYLNHHRNPKKSARARRSENPAVAHARFVLDLMLDEALLGYIVQPHDLPDSIRRNLDYPLPAFESFQGHLPKIIYLTLSQYKYIMTCE
ncbi:hypothetical protein LTR27_006159 [Elasticomyces elasticus]|nr:hypothetical protein LTR27_006159 [Elasticomyces elasticus]